MSERNDGVNETGLDYRAGYIEGLRHYLNRLALDAMRAPKKDGAGLCRAAEVAREAMQNMIAQMRADISASEPNQGDLGVSDDTTGNDQHGTK